MKTERIYLWEDRKDVYLDTYIPEHDPFVYGKKKNPCMIVVPGGAYLMCSMSNEGEPVALGYLQAGYNVVVLHYTVAETAGNRSGRFPAQLIDLGKAFLTVKEHADEWGIDANYISMVGFSAGGNLVGLYATRWHEEILSNALGRKPEEFKPFATLLIYGVLDYIAQYEFEKDRPSNKMMKASAQYYIGSAAPTKEEFEAVSPTKFVGPNTPPTFLAHAANDELVTPVNSLSMAMALQCNQIPYELHIFKKGGHGFGSGQEIGEPQYRTNKLMSAANWMKLSQEWLLKMMLPELRDKDFSDPDVFEGKEMDIPDFMKEMAVLQKESCK